MSSIARCFRTNPRRRTDGIIPTIDSDPMENLELAEGRPPVPKFSNYAGPLRHRAFGLLGNSLLAGPRPRPEFGQAGFPRRHAPRPPDFRPWRYGGPLQRRNVRPGAFGNPGRPKR